MPNKCKMKGVTTMPNKMTYMDAWHILSKMEAEVHFNVYKPSKARLGRESMAIGMLFELCQRADKKEGDKK